MWIRSSGPAHRPVKKRGVGQDIELAVLQKPNHKSSQPARPGPQSAKKKKTYSCVYRLFLYERSKFLYD